MKDTKYPQGKPGHRWHSIYIGVEDFQYVIELRVLVVIVMSY
jgi:hypothetical protein